MSDGFFPPSISQQEAGFTLELIFDERHSIAALLASYFAGRTGH